MLIFKPLITLSMLCPWLVMAIYIEPYNVTKSNNTLETLSLKRYQSTTNVDHQILFRASYQAAASKGLKDELTSLRKQLEQVKSSQWSETDEWDETDDWEDADPWGEAIQAFIDLRVGSRTQTDPLQKGPSISEMRGQVKFEYDFNDVLLTSTSDLVFDSVVDNHSLDLDNGDGWLDLREISLFFSFGPNVDIKMGRQILTWGTGDLLFINDLFPKDWNAFLIGRDTQYLKAPSDAIKASIFFDWLNLDIVYTPKFDSDRFIDGRRLSLFNPIALEITGRAQPLKVDKPDELFRDHEVAVRAYRTIESFELGFYFYQGFWKSPSGYSFNTGLFVFPEVVSYGASARGPVASGIGNIEFGLYDSKNDPDGSNPQINNSEWRLLLGYEQELAVDFTGAIQFYVETLRDYSQFRLNMLGAAYVRSKHRQVITVRLTQRLMNQNVVLSAFNFWSPSEDDGYLRLNANYKYSDHWSLEIGANQFYGDRQETFFGQLKSNSNFYFSTSYNF